LINNRFTTKSADDFNNNSIYNIDNNHNNISPADGGRPLLPPDTATSTTTISTNSDTSANTHGAPHVAVRPLNRTTSGYTNLECVHVQNVLQWHEKMQKTKYMYTTHAPFTPYGGRKSIRADSSSHVYFINIIIYSGRRRL